MANIKDLKKKIKSTKSTLKITTAMKLVSAAKLNKAQMAIINARPYASELEQIVKVASALNEKFTHQFLKINSDANKVLVVAVSSNRGLCGSYNSSVIKKIRALSKDIDQSYEFFFVGKKAFDVVKKEVSVVDKFIYDKTEPSYNDIIEITNKIIEYFQSGTYRSVQIIFNEFKSAISFNTVFKQILPMTLEEKDRQKYKDEYPFDFKYEPSAKYVLDQLIQEAFKSIIHTALLDAVASEQGSRMSAMDSASKNCKEAINKKTLVMNKLRQAAITTELIEVVSGAESLKG